MKALVRKHFYRRAGGWILTLALVYGVFIGSLFVMQKSLMYFPDQARFVPAEWALPELQPLEVTAEDGLRITSWYRPAQARDKMTIVFFQGNAGHLGYRNYKVRPWLDAGYGVLMVGYRGFGNPGSPSEEGLYMDAQAAIDAIKAKTAPGGGVPEAGIVFYGESMGTGVAVQMATEYNAAALILESPYTSIPDVGADRYPLVPVRWLLRDKYDSLAKIGNVHMPLLLLHGELDEVVPVKFGKKLFAAANEPKQSYWAPDAGHNNVYNLKVQQIILNFIADLPTDPLLNRGS
ncbi:MAG: alpha/beta hydrolase [Alphaproteobacteria bacterium]|nr:alpha/beta hydrolase [Alphaproteobacteria bacterium]